MQFFDLKILQNFFRPKDKTTNNYLLKQDGVIAQFFELFLLLI